MKVLMAADFPRSLSDVRGGTWAAALNLTEALIEHTDASIVTVSFRRDLKAPERIVRHGGRLDVRQYPLGRYGGVTRHASQRREFKRLLKETNPDIVHAQGEGFYSSLAVHSGRPHVYTIHGIRLKELRMERRQLGYLRYTLRKREIEEHHRLAKHIITINEYTKKAIEGLHNARVWEIPNAVRQDLIDLGATRVVNTVGSRVLMVGGVRPRKDIITALRTVEALRERGMPIKLDVVGPNADKDYVGSVERFIQENELAEHVTIHGLVDDDELKRRYAEADVFLLTSIEESSPICLVEAMAAGLPIVATDVGGIAEMLADNAVLCRSGDVDGIVDALASVLSSADARARMSSVSSEIARSKWSAKAVALATYSAYQEIARTF
jgi:glycosyltransferase involved in cell wall biosynthesis